MHGRGERERLGDLYPERGEHRAPPQPREAFGLRETVPEQAQRRGAHQQHDQRLPCDLRRGEQRAPDEHHRRVERVLDQAREPFVDRVLDLAGDVKEPRMARLARAHASALGGRRGIRQRRADLDAATFDRRPFSFGCAPGERRRGSRRRAHLAGGRARGRRGSSRRGAERHRGERRKECQARFHAPTMCCKTVTSTGASAASA
jgi:hypothetical protein